MRRVRWIATMMALATLLGACSGDTGGATETEALDSGAAAEAPAAGDDAGGPEDVVANQQAIDRKVIRTGQIEIQASDTRAAMDEITALVNRSGGYVSSSEVSPTGGEGHPFITLTIRVPAGDLDTALTAIRGLADEVVLESIQSQDVTEEYVDIEARLRNLGVLETELLALLADVRQEADTDPQKILAVFNEVSRVRGEIEVLEGRRRLIDNQASLSTITVSIVPSPSVQPIVEDVWQPGETVRQAVGNLVQAVQNIGDLAIWLVVFALPVLLMLGLGLWLAVAVLKRLTRARTPQARPVVPPPTAAPPAAASIQEADGATADD